MKNEDIIISEVESTVRKILRDMLRRVHLVAEDESEDEYDAGYCDGFNNCFRKLEIECENKLKEVHDRYKKIQS